MNFSTYLGERARLFKNKNYLAFVLNCLLAPFGNGFVYIALSWHTQSLSGSPGGVALLMLCLWGPTVLLAPVAGWLVDFGSPGMMALLSNLGRGLLMTLLAVLIRHWEEYQWIFIYSISLLIGSLSSLYGPAALTLIRGVVPEKDLLYANSTADIVIETGSIVGMGLAGIFLAWAGVSLSMIAGGLCFGLAGLCFLFIRTEYPVTKEESPLKDSVHGSLRQSWVILRASRALRSAYLMQAVLLMMLMTVPVLLVPYAQTVLKAGVDDFSRMEALFSVGAVAGGILIPFIIQRLNKSLTTGVVWGMMALVFLLLAKTESLLIAEFLYFFVGFGLASWAVVLSSAQEQTPIDHQGRLVSLSNGTGGIIAMLLYILLYSFGDIIPVQNLYYIEAGFCLFLIVLLVRNPLDGSPSEARLSPFSGPAVHQESGP